ncbi:hypothetical protein H0H87_010914, partial [Tephrocybe sp. NHM501043]
GRDMPFPRDWTVDRRYPTKGKRKYPLPLPHLSPQEAQLLTVPAEQEIIVLGAEPEYLDPPYIAQLLDLRLRRFYTILADHSTDGYESDLLLVLEDPYWANILVSTNHRVRGGFNRINVNSDNGELNLKLLPEEHVARPLRNLEPPSVQQQQMGVPSVPFTALRDRKYLISTAETCTWNGLPYVFKQPLVEGHVEHMHREVALNGQVRDSPYIVALAAFIVDEDGLLRGQLYPWSGVRIDTLPSVTWQMLRDVLAGLRDIGRATMPDHSTGNIVAASHGDVFSRNVVVQDGRARLIDAGNEGLNYEGDRGAAITMFSSLAEKMPTEEDKKKLSVMLELLKTDLGFEVIVERLSQEYDT